VSTKTLLNGLRVPPAAPMAGPGAGGAVSGAGPG
jgi:hypothetical protein